MIKKNVFINTVVVTCIVSLLAGFFVCKIAKQSNDDLVQNRESITENVEGVEQTNSPVKPYSSFLVNGSGDVVKKLNDNSIDKKYFIEYSNAKSIEQEQTALKNWNNAYKEEFKNAKNTLDETIKNRKSANNYNNVLLKTIEEYYNSSTVYTEATAQLAYNFEEYNLGEGSNHSYNLLLNSLQINRINTLRLIECIYMLDIDYMWTQQQWDMGQGGTGTVLCSTDNSDYQITSDEINCNNSTALSNQYIYDNDDNLVRQKNRQCNDNGQPLTVNYRYDYDSKDRIVGKGYSGIEYFNHYDSKGQLVREDYRLSGSDTYTYTYDSRGNITAKNEYVYTTGSLENATPTSTQTFTYATSGWTDKLTAVDNTPLTYDAIGNVLTYGNRSFTWSNGRNLAQITEGTDTYSYTYDENGIRTSKTVNGVTTQYNTKDGVILAQSDGTNTMTFQYDTAGQPLGFTYNGTQYTYLVSQSGIIMAVMDSTGHFIVGYDYDEWGKPINTYFTDRTLSAEQIAAVNANPLRYKGYYYDQETSYYYLQSRYYDPSICRFINADLPQYAIAQKNACVGLNSFAYCCNDPVNCVDLFGYSNKSPKISDKDKNVYVTDFIKKYKLKQDGFNCYAYAIGKYYNHVYISGFSSESTIKECTKKVIEYLKTNKMKPLNVTYKGGASYPTSGHSWLIALRIGSYYVFDGKTIYECFDFHFMKRSNKTGQWSFKAGKGGQVLELKKVRKKSKKTPLTPNDIYWNVYSKDNIIYAIGAYTSKIVYIRVTNQER